MYISLVEHVQNILMYIHCFMFCFEIDQRQESEIDKDLVYAFLNLAFVYFLLDMLTLFYGWINVWAFCCVYALCYSLNVHSLFGVKYYPHFQLYKELWTENNYNVLVCIGSDSHCLKLVSFFCDIFMKETKNIFYTKYASFDWPNYLIYPFNQFTVLLLGFCFRLFTNLTGKFSILELNLFLVDFSVKRHHFKRWQFVPSSMFSCVSDYQCIFHFYEMPNQLCFLILVLSCSVECFSFKTHEFTVGSSPWF